MADGRDLFYFTQSPLASDPPPDTRPIEPVQSTGTLRHDALNDEWVTIAGHRQGRIFLPSTSECPLCPSTPGNRTEIPAADFEVAVFQNRFPSLAPPADPGWTLAGEPEPANAGRCEVICFSADHDAAFRDLTPERVRLIVAAWADRTAALMDLPYVQHVFPFENCGEEIGVTIRHPHGQIYAYPFVPPRALGRLQAGMRHQQATGRHLVDDVIAREVADGERIVAETEHWIAFVPYAARWPFQVQLHPRRSMLDLTELDDAGAEDFARIYPDLLTRLDGLFGVRMPYIAAWFQAPKGELRAAGRLYLELFTNRRAPDKLKYLAGSEAAMGAFINDIRPEDAARVLREAR